MFLGSFDSFYKESYMDELLRRLPDLIKQIYDILDLIVVRTTVLGLALVGGYALFKQHSHDIRDQQNRPRARACRRKRKAATGQT
jgi:hypothetical protein